MRRLLVIVAVLAGLTATAGSAATPQTAHGPLTGKWRGTLSGTLNGKPNQERITITINGRQTRGTWTRNPYCHGTLTLDSISNGYHHYLRHVAPGLTCPAGDIDCLEREGAKVADSITPRPEGWDRHGALHRVRS